MAEKFSLTTDRPGYFQTFKSERHLTGDYVVETLQNCEPIVEAARVLSDMNPGKEFRHVGFIPDIFMDDILRRARVRARQHNGRIDGAQLQDEIKALCRAFLNNPDNARFRTWPGKL
jgi:hypothetical protein